MRKRALIIAFVFGIFMPLNILSQNIMQNDPFLGVWFSEFDEVKYVQIYINGVVIKLREDSNESEIFKYTVSGNSIIIDDDDENFSFIIVDSNTIILEQDGISIIIVKQNGPDIKQKNRIFS